MRACDCGNSELKARQFGEHGADWWMVKCEVCGRVGIGGATRERSEKNWEAGMVMAEGLTGLEQKDVEEV